MRSSLTILAMCLFTACADTPITEPDTAAAFGVNVVDRSNTLEPFSFSLPYTCSPPAETVHLSGTLHTTSNRFVDGNGTEHWSFHSHPANVRGVGEVSGREFRIVGSESTTRTIDEDNQRTFRQTATLRLRSPGEPTWTLRFHLLRRGSPGNWTYVFDKSETECSG